MLLVPGLHAHGLLDGRRRTRRLQFSSPQRILQGLRPLLLLLLLISVDSGITDLVVDRRAL